MEPVSVLKQLEAAESWGKLRGVWLQSGDNLQEPLVMPQVLRAFRRCKMSAKDTATIQVSGG
jgi:hypothetical protein